MASPDKKPDLLAQMDVPNQKKSAIDFQIGEDAHPDDKNLLAVLRSLQYLLSHFPGGDSDEGSEQYQITALQVRFHNMSYDLNPRKRIAFDHQALGPKVQTLWEDVKSSRIEFAFQNPDPNLETEEEQHWGVAVKQDESLPIATVYLPDNIHHDFEEIPQGLIAYIAGVSHIIHMIEEAKAGRWSEKINEVDIQEIEEEMFESLKLNLTAITALFDSMGSRKVGIFSFYEFLKRLEKFNQLQN